MTRVQIVITEAEDGKLALAYLGADAAKAEEAYGKASSDAKLANVRRFNYPAHTVVCYPRQDKIQREAEAADKKAREEKEAQAVKLAAEAKLAEGKRLTAEAEAILKGPDKPA